HATPVVVDGYVYFGTATKEPTFYRLTPDGKLVWSYRNPVPPQPPPPEVRPTAKEVGELCFQSQAPDAILSSALVTKDAVFFGDEGGRFYALERATGKERWKIDTRAKEFPGAHPLNVTFSSPILADGKVIVTGGALEQIFAALPTYKGCTGRGYVAALDPKTGKIMRKYDVGPKPEQLDPPITITGSPGAHALCFAPATTATRSSPAV